MKKEAKVGVVRLQAEQHQVAAGSHLKLERGMEWIIRLSFQKEPMLLTAGLQVLASRTAREYLSVVLCPPTGGDFLWQP